MDSVDLLALIVSVFALAVAGVAAWYTRGQKLAADRAVTEAKRAADSAAEMTAIERARRADEQAAVERDRIKFQLVNEKAGVFRLHNAGAGSAYYVTFNTAKDLKEIAEFKSGASESVYLAGPLRSRRVGG